MGILLSNFHPGKFPTVETARNLFLKNIQNADHIKIGTGYISTDSLVELKKIIDLNKRPKVDMLIGMHFFEGFTKNQHSAALDLNEFLISKDLGRIYISNTIKFHGKMYSFSKANIPFAGIIGSSNFSSIVSDDRLYETDYSITSKQEIIDADKYLLKLISSLGTRIDLVNIAAYIENNSLLNNQYGVERVSSTEVLQKFRESGNISFNLPIKPKPKSNLNIFFGKGRENQRGFATPRPWYEAELIVSNSITKQNGYPYCESFTVVTDDGWKFKCKTSGDFSKNFRSEDDLKILGKWLKGRLEDSGALKIGEQVTEDVLKRYGRDHVTLTSTLDPNVWTLDFKS